ncbi:MAG: FixH family protein [Rhodospirillaceae bacterium]|nr:FixH family protein [Rhodospirillaceae bacterium]
MRSLFRSDRWIPWTFVAGFGVILLANGIMVFSAFNSWNGVSTDDAYRRGLEYNRQLAEQQRVVATGWAVAARLDGKGNHRNLLVAIKDKSGKFIPDATVVARFERPIERGLDFSVKMQSTVGGQYNAAITLPKYGQWRLVLSIAARTGTVTATRRYNLRP